MQLHRHGCPRGPHLHRWINQWFASAKSAASFTIANKQEIINAINEQMGCIWRFDARLRHRRAFSRATLDLEQCLKDWTPRI